MEKCVSLVLNEVFFIVVNRSTTKMKIASFIFILTEDFIAFLEIMSVHQLLEFDKKIIYI